MSTSFDSTQQDVENPLHNEKTTHDNGYEQISTSPRKAKLDGIIRPTDSTESKKRERPPVDYTGHFAVLLMFIVGCFSGVFVNIVLWASAMLSLMQVKLINSNPAGPFCLMLTTAGLAALSAFVCKKSGRVAVLGSGIPEVKALLTNDFHPTELAMIVSSRIGFTRMVAMIMCLGAGMSIGSAAPLVHMTVCNAYTIMKFIPDFGCLLENPNMMRQIFNASAAAGMAACFNCPLGGVLFSIEVTSTHYLLVNYWRSFMAAVAGAVLFSVIQWWRGIEESRPFPMTYNPDPYDHWEFPLYFLLGLICAFGSFVYLQMQQQWFLLVRKINVAHPVLTAAVVGAFTALMIWAVGSYSAKGLTTATVVKDLLGTADHSELTQYPNVSRIGGLFATLIIRWMLTITNTTLRLPAGFFTPMLMIGALIGRIFGQCVQDIMGDTARIYVPGYALVGACAFASGTTHTISAAVVMLESTGQISMFLPCLIGAIVGSGFVKGYTVNLYNQGLINKGLESFEQLLLESGDFNTAKDMMDIKAVYVTRHCQIGDLLAMMEHGKLNTFAVIDSVESCKLLGSVTRKDVYQYLKRFYALHGLVAFVRQTMPEDTKQDDYRIARRKKMEARTQWLRTQIVLPSEIADEEALNAAAAQGGGGFGAIMNPLTGSNHGNRSTHGTTSNAQRSAVPTQQPPSRRTRAVYEDEEGGHSSGEDDGDDDEANESDEYASPRSSLTRGLESSTGQYGVEMTSAVRRMSGAFPDMSGSSPPQDTATPAASTTQPTSIQLQALLDAHRPGHRGFGSSTGSDFGSPMDSTRRTGSGSDGGEPATSPRSRSADGASSGVSSTSLGKLDLVVGRLSSAMQFKKQMREKLAFMNKEQEARAQLLRKHTVDLVKENLLPINVDPFTVHSTSSVDQVYMLFNSVKINCVFVVEEDQVLQGMISQVNLMQRLKKKN